MNKFAVFLTLLLLALIVVSCKNTSDTKTLDDLALPDMELLFQDYETMEENKTYAAFADKLVTKNKDLQSSELYVEAARLYALANQIDNSFEMLNLAIDKGMSNPNILSKLNLEESIKNTSQGSLLIARLDSIEKQLSKVENFDLEMGSMDLFWTYYEKAKKDTLKARVIFKEYVLKGPPEIRDYYVVRYSNPSMMYAQMVKTAPNYYDYLKKQFNSDSIKTIKSKTAAWMRTFKNIYPKAVFPKVYIVPGILNSGGTATEMGMFVGGDMYGKSEMMPTEELNDWQKGAIMQFGDLPGLTIHELMHFQQNYRDTINTKNVLRGVIEEGVCDFLLELCSGEVRRSENLKYLQTEEQAEKIWHDLKRDLLTDDFSRWLYNGGDIEDRPHDLGYTVGYLITKSYYEQHQNKQKAVYNLLNTSDFKAILAASEYSHLLN